MKQIMNDVKILTEYTLKTSAINKNIFKNVCFDILDVIDKSISNEISTKEFETKLKKSWEGMIKRHVEWLIDNKIIWRSALTYNHEQAEKNVAKYNTFRYDIHNEVKITNYDRFVYTTMNSLECVETKYAIDNELNMLLISLKKVQIDFDGAMQCIYNLKIADKIKERKLKRKLSRLVCNIALQSHTIGYGKNVKRVFHTITSLKKDLHQFLYLNGKQVTVVDAKQSQLTLISNLTRNINSDFHNIIDNGYFYDELINYFKEKLEYNESVDIDNDKAGFLCYWKETEKKGEKYKQIHWTEINKEHIKSLVYASLFSGFTNNSEVTKYMKEHYSDILVEFQNKVKESGYESCAAFLQDLEAEIFVTTAIELIDKGIDVITKHDSLMFEPQYKDIVMEVLHNNYIKNEIIKYKPDFEQIGTLECNEFKIPIIETITDDSMNYMSEVNKENGNTDLTEYTFKNKVTNETFTGCKSDFAKQYNLDRSDINKLINGKLKTVKKWSLI